MPESPGPWAAVAFVAGLAAVSSDRRALLGMRGDRACQNERGSRENQNMLLHF